MPTIPRSHPQDQFLRAVVAPVRILVSWLAWPGLISRCSFEKSVSSRLPPPLSPLNPTDRAERESNGMFTYTLCFRYTVDHTNIAYQSSVQQLLESTRVLSMYGVHCNDNAHTVVGAPHTAQPRRGDGCNTQYKIISANHRCSSMSFPKCILFSARLLEINRALLLAHDDQ